MYVDSKYECPSAGPLQRYVEPLLLTHGVDLALWFGHELSELAPFAVTKKKQDAGLVDSDCLSVVVVVVFNLPFFYC